MASSSVSSSRNAWAKHGDRSLLPQSFYARHTLRVAQDLLGKHLEVRVPRGQTHWVRIVETEAYRGSADELGRKDPASHASRGPTPRSKIMFGPPGVAYVYFIYGNYDMLNFVTEPDGAPGAVLIRAVEPLSDPRLATHGPGRLTRALGIKRDQDNGQALFKTGSKARFRVWAAGPPPSEPIHATPRVGIRVGTELYWRFLLAGNRFVSPCAENRLARPLPTS